MTHQPLGRRSNSKFANGGLCSTCFFLLCHFFRERERKNQTKEDMLVHKPEYILPHTHPITVGFPIVFVNYCLKTEAHKKKSCGSQEYFLCITIHNQVANKLSMDSCVQLIEWERERERGIEKKKKKRYSRVNIGSSSSI
jgi:hypothetical protein